MDPSFFHEDVPIHSSLDRMNRIDTMRCRHDPFHHQGWKKTISNASTIHYLLAMTMAMGRHYLIRNSLHANSYRSPGCSDHGNDSPHRPFLHKSRVKVTQVSESKFDEVYISLLKLLIANSP